MHNIVLSMTAAPVSELYTVANALVYRCGRRLKNKINIFESVQYIGKTIMRLIFIQHLIVLSPSNIIRSTGKKSWGQIVNNIRLAFKLHSNENKNRFGSVVSEFSSTSYRVESTSQNSDSNTCSIRSVVALFNKQLWENNLIILPYPNYLFGWIFYLILK